MNKIGRMDVDGCWMKCQWMVDGTKQNDDYTKDGALERSTSVSFATMAWKREERNCFFLFRVFYKKNLFFFLLPKLLQGLFTT